MIGVRQMNWDRDNDRLQTARAVRLGNAGDENKYEELVRNTETLLGLR